MKARILLLILSLFVISTCSKAPEEKGTGYLSLNINKSTSLKSGIEIEDFTLCISNGSVDVLKERIGDLPDEIALPVGTYTIEAYSKEFFDPKFEEPFYTGKTTVEIEAGETKEASLVCSQGNAGVKVVWSGEFSTLFTTYYAQVDCNEGYLHYQSDEERTGYFLPGTVSFSIMADGKNIYGGSLVLAARDMLTATLKPKIEDDPSGGLTISISIDETVNNREVEIIFDPNTGNQGGDNSETNPYNISEAIVKQGENGVWVMGYIVGASSAQNFVSGTKQATIIVLADDAAETNYTKTILVQLQSGTDQQKDLNLVENPDNLYQKVAIKGNLALYYSRPGLIGVSDFLFPYTN